jgi:hypothetical protein
VAIKFVVFVSAESMKALVRGVLNVVFLFLRMPSSVEVLNIVLLSLSPTFMFPSGLSKFPDSQTTSAHLSFFLNPDISANTVEL